MKVRLHISVRAGRGEGSENFIRELADKYNVGRELLSNMLKTSDFYYSLISDTILVCGTGGAEILDGGCWLHSIRTMDEQN